MTDGRTDRRTDGGDCNIPDAFLKKRGDNRQSRVMVLGYEIILVAFMTHRLTLFTTV